MKRQALKYTVLMYVIVILCVAFVASLAHGQLDVKSQYQLGEPIVVKMVVEGKPEGAELRKDKFKCPGANLIKVDDTTWHVWALPGKYTIEAYGEWRLYQVIVSKDDKEYKVIADEDDYEFSASFEVIGGEAPKPVTPPTPPGSKWGLLIRETKGGQDPALGNLLIKLRETIPSGKLVIHDPTSLPPKLQPLVGSSVTLPALMVVARQADGTDKVVKTVPITATTTVEAVEKELQ